MGIPIYQVDAFADQPFTGNPAAVCLLSDRREAAWMQAVARELNLSETAFLHPEGDGYQLRWFTPAVEVALCGHATLASAHVLWETGRLRAEEVAAFETQSGLLTAERQDPDILMTFPATPVEPAAPPPGLGEALGLEPAFVGRSRFDYLVEVDAPATLQALRPDFRRLAAVPARGVIVTSRSDQPQYDFLSRFFAPAAGVDEDPVTGSAHCALGPYWEARLGRSELTGYQASARGGVVKVQVAGDDVFLSGRAVTVWRGELL
jgi:PhzF family phenazine biosynthesis protein